MFEGYGTKRVKKEQRCMYVVGPRNAEQQLFLVIFHRSNMMYMWTRSSKEDSFNETTLVKETRNMGVAHLAIGVALARDQVRNGTE